MSADDTQIILDPELTAGHVDWIHAAANLEPYEGWQDDTQIHRALECLTQTGDVRRAAVILRALPGAPVTELWDGVPAPVTLFACGCELPYDAGADPGDVCPACVRPPVLEGVIVAKKAVTRPRKPKAVTAGTGPEPAA